MRRPRGGADLRSKRQSQFTKRVVTSFTSTNTRVSHAQYAQLRASLATRASRCCAGKGWAPNCSAAAASSAAHIHSVSIFPTPSMRPFSRGTVKDGERRRSVAITLARTTAKLVKHYNYIFIMGSVPDWSCVVVATARYSRLSQRSSPGPELASATR